MGFSELSALIAKKKAARLALERKKRVKAQNPHINEFPEPDAPAETPAVAHPVEIPVAPSSNPPESPVEKKTTVKKKKYRKKAVEVSDNAGE